jgi:hypothetical protein
MRRTIGSVADWVVVEGVTNKEPTTLKYTALRERMLPLMPKVYKESVIFQLAPLPRPGICLIIYLSFLRLRTNDATESRRPMMWRQVLPDLFYTIPNSVASTRTLLNTVGDSDPLHRLFG